LARTITGRYPGTLAGDISSTDHYRFKYLLNQRLATIPQHQCVSKLTGFDFHVEYKPGSSNTVANALSRRDTGEDGQLAAVSAPLFMVFDDLRVETEGVESLRRLKEEVIVGRKGEAWKIVDGLVTVGAKHMWQQTHHACRRSWQQHTGWGMKGLKKRCTTCTEISSSREYERP
jgi:hypothetical protein